MKSTVTTCFYDRFPITVYFSSFLSGKWVECHRGSAGNVMIIINENVYIFAQELVPTDINGLADPYCILKLIPARFEVNILYLL